MRVSEMGRLIALGIGDQQSWACPGGRRGRRTEDVASWVVATHLLSVGGPADGAVIENADGFCVCSARSRRDGRAGGSPVALAWTPPMTGRRCLPAAVDLPATVDHRRTTVCAARH